MSMILLVGSAGSALFDRILSTVGCDIGLVGVASGSAEGRVTAGLVSSPRRRSL